MIRILSHDHSSYCTEYRFRNHQPIYVIAIPRSLGFSKLFALITVPDRKADNMEERLSPDLPVPSDGKSVNLADPSMFIELTSDSYVNVPPLGLQVRDLGLAGLTNGLLAAQAVRASPDYDTLPGHWHMHDLKLQVGYVVSGWVTYEFDGVGVKRFDRGACIVHVPRNRLRMLAVSPDFEGIWFKNPNQEVVTFWQYQPDDDTYLETAIDVVVN